MKLIIYFIFLLSVLLTHFVYADATEDKKQLKKIQQQIVQKENSLGITKKEVDKLNKTLADQNKKIQSIEKELKKISNEINESKKISIENENAINQLKESVNAQKTRLEKQIELAFKQGQSSSLEMLFANKDAQKNDRMVGYINYINREREATISKIREQEATIQLKQNEVNAQLIAQEKLIEDQKNNIKSLEIVKANYAKTLKQLNKEAIQTEQQIVSLKDDEINLQYQIDRAIKASTNSLSSSSNASSKKDKNAFIANQNETMSHNNPWPVDGKIFTHFGESLGGEITSKGLVIEARITSDVRAIKSGNVLIADYLQGYGKVIVVDHGGDFMSLYGYNNDVLVNPGDKVNTGQVIGKVGLVEGGYRSALYFEIRYQGEAVNPNKYLLK